MNLKKTLVILFAVSLGAPTVSNAQLFKKIFKKKDKKEEKTEEKKEEAHVHNPWHLKNVGKVVFYNKSIEYNTSSTSDSETSMISERVLAGTGPFSFRAYLDKSYKGACEGCDGFDIRYSIGDVSLTTEEVRASGAPTYYPRMASNYSFYDGKNYSVGVPLNAAPGKYYDMYTLQEDTYRMLLSKAKASLKIGSTVTLKVEIISTKADVPTGNILAVGEIPLKITADSKNLQSLNCRCGRSGMTDDQAVKDAIEAFEFQFNDVTKVYKVVLLERDFSLTNNGDAKGMWANFVYERTDGITMMVKRYFFYKKNGEGFSKKATIGKHKFYLPVSPTCTM
jgi:hypothetical protein